MWQQKSYKNDGGLLYLVPTPIGNLEDMSFRAVRILKEADIIAAEDTRNTKKLCNHFEITTPIVSYHEHNKEASGRKLIETLQSGKTVALVSDAGMPTIADPGYELVVAAVENRLPVVPLPGANAALTALIASGLPTHPFYFYGFLNRQKKEKKKELEALKYISGTVLLYESPHRLKETLQLIKDILGDRNISLCRELTKIYEEFIRGTIDEVIDWANTDEIRGEFCIVIEKGEAVEASDEQWWTSLSIVEHVNHYIEVDDLQAKDAIKRTAVDRSMPKREVYQEYHID
ncbi:16S rRNA (cytidine(1402)-2'-O)-methyltransferase [Niallia taxi]|uniref:16S rRNA (cytidine(1402)-2'-O)-methyltransferase n=1 Tax=Niallia taxi TaxID=2499688 RepID=UPI0011A2F970|nr:16S rRNA (cytidine(1402)-2'-O)-methyltransferase [Niallia taxi]MCT2346755.1 16S rRNA (cytidine(1402)-2'-O)-methyltransferase [Niallia taxi]MDE5055898.1 16S rRNA (cytidine(1402)-2'-O)-methyltransferase [Niallia taxi]MED3965740.1 16S rRNA (cytidine(1402)-2'-O)-methyltransferase [Niallia taxi]WOD64557.1 16S rRNA (cytidine(1402)-2'-O)-methyltransferase [Niallia taxi]